MTISVVHIQTHLTAAGNAAARLHECMRNNGIDSRMLSMSSDVPSSGRIQKFGTLQAILSYLRGRVHSKLLVDRSADWGVFSVPFGGVDVSGHPFVTSANVIYLHWINGGFLSFHGISKLLALGKPVIVFMHDMWTLTGGCHHSFNCQQFGDGCRACPAQPRRWQKRIVAEAFQRKIRLYAKAHNVAFVSPSHWLGAQAVVSEVTRGKRRLVIPNIVSERRFAKIDKASARSLLGLPNGVKIIAFGAASVKNPYKGFDAMLKSLELLAVDFANEKLHLAIFGGGEASSERLPFEATFLGRLNDEYSLSAVYNAADVFVMPSRAESFGLVALESIRCGTPVAAFDVGGISDIVQHKVNGFLSRANDSRSLAEGIEFCFKGNLPMTIPPGLNPDEIVLAHIGLINEMRQNV